jgi:hypothetical protein
MAASAVNCSTAVRWKADSSASAESRTREEDVAGRAIVGGALLPPVFGYISDLTDHIQSAYIVPLVCFAVVFFFGAFGTKKEISA